MEIFKLENNILRSNGLQTRPASSIQLMMIDALTINIPDLQQQQPMATHVPPACSALVQHGESTENAVPTSVAEVHLAILQSAAKNEDVTQALTTVWCKLYQGSMKQFVQDNVHIVQDLASGDAIASVAGELKLSGNFGDFSRLSHEKPNIYKFLNQYAEFDDDNITAATQYLLGFTATDKQWDTQAVIVQILLEYMCNLCAAYQIVK